MNKLTDAQSDCLTEICNIGISRAASQLSILLNDVVHISIPNVRITDLAGLSYDIGMSIDDACITVCQTMSGALNGRAALLFDQAASDKLVDLTLSGMGSIVSVQLDLYRQEALVEIGNIIVSASVSVLADFIRSEIELSVPALNNQTVRQLLEIDGETSSSILVMSTVLESSHERVTGVLLYTFDSGVLEVLLNSLQSHDLGGKHV